MRIFVDIVELRIFIFDKRILFNGAVFHIYSVTQSEIESQQSVEPRAKPDFKYFDCFVMGDIVQTTVYEHKKRFLNCAVHRMIMLIKMRNVECA